MDTTAILKLARAVVNQQLERYEGDDLAGLLRHIQTDLTKLCNSFCDWILMDYPRFTLQVDTDEKENIHINVTMLFPLEDQLDVTLEVTADE